MVRALVRTDTSAGKRDGISFVLLPMNQEGVTTKPIQLISGISPFCETFFDNARTDKKELLGPQTRGGVLLKGCYSTSDKVKPRLEARVPRVVSSLQEIAKKYVGIDNSGKLDDPDLRVRLVEHLMDSQAHNLTVGRITEVLKRKSRGQCSSIYFEKSRNYSSRKLRINSGIDGKSRCWMGRR